MAPKIRPPPPRFFPQNPKVTNLSKIGKKTGIKKKKKKKRLNRLVFPTLKTFWVFQKRAKIPT